MTPSEWITIISTIATVAVGAGLVLGKLAAIVERTGRLERGNIDGKRRLGSLQERMAVAEYKLFGKRPTAAAGEESDEGSGKT